MTYELIAVEGTPGLPVEAVKALLSQAFGSYGAKKKVLALPPDGTRSRSFAGLITKLMLDHYGKALADIMPALGTHEAMSAHELDLHFPGLPPSLFRVHDWRKDLSTLGMVPGDFVKRISEGKLDYEWPAQVNRLVSEGGHDLIVSIGQVVPHEVAGMANHAKNLFVGTGGAEGIHRSHFLGAVYGLERIMGRTDTPVRALLDYASREFAKNLPVVYVQTVVADTREGKPELRGIFVGEGREPFEKASALSRKLNLNILEKPIKKAVVYLEPHEYKSTWLGNKSVYRTRMAIADGGELVVLGPEIARFGEDLTIDKLIRRHGYNGTERTLAAVKKDPELAANLSAAAHLIHGSSEGRFTVTYCPGRMSREETEGAGYRYAEYAKMAVKYDPFKLEPGINTMPDGEEVFFVRNPAAGLWALREKFGGT